MTALVMFFFLSPNVDSHCEVPCGIYNDEMRFEMIMEHIQTIEKAIHEIEHLSQEQPLNYNQIVRWITNKEKHAEELQYIISRYFLAQRINPVDGKDKKAQEIYLKHLSLCHHILVMTMKTKQSLDHTNVEKLKSYVASFRESYFKAKNQQKEMNT